MLSHVGADHPIAMVLLIFICLLGITTVAKGAFLQQKLKSFMKFKKIDSYNQ